MTAGADKRRINGQVTREKLLAAGEQAFADHGFDGASTRMIADSAETDIALIVYHFGSKLGLYREIFLRRAEALNARRLSELDVALANSNGGTPSLTPIVKALVATNIRLRTDKELGGLPVARLFAREMIEPKQADRHIIGDMFDETAKRFMSALQLALPNTSFEAISWAYHFAISAVVQTMANVSRLEALSNGTCDMSDGERAIDHLVPFIVGGITSCVAAHVDMQAIPKIIPGRTQAVPKRQKKISVP